MTVDVVLEKSHQQIVDAAFEALGRSHLEAYAAAGETFTRDGLETLYVKVIAAIRQRDVGDLDTYVAQLADQRFSSGFDVSDVQTAFNALEEVMWRLLIAEVPAEELAESIGLLSTVLGSGKDRLAREYVSLASRHHVTSLDLSTLFTGTNS
jgi:hypothetical protein